MKAKYGSRLVADSLGWGMKDEWGTTLRDAQWQGLHPELPVPYSDALSTKNAAAVALVAAKQRRLNASGGGGGGDALDALVAKH